MKNVPKWEEIPSLQLFRAKALGGWLIQKFLDSENILFLSDPGYVWLTPDCPTQQGDDEIGGETEDEENLRMAIYPDDFFEED